MHVQFSILTVLLVAVLGLSLVGCDKDADKIDHTQVNVTRANDNLAQMKQISDRLVLLNFAIDVTYEVDTRSESYKQSVLRLTSETDSIEIKTALENYIQLGEDTLRIADRQDVHFNDHRGLRTRILNAKKWLEAFAASP